LSTADLFAPGHAKTPAERRQAAAARRKRELERIIGTILAVQQQKSEAK
jgi:hypothetical protein